MGYKVFLVEDEIVTREGIRDNVDWEAVGFEFCGEAPDGEMALPLIEAAKPDVLITDIKMPFMDGLQLSKIIRERMPWTKIIILSGHNEFEYAQSAVKLGLTEYLLKPVSAQDLNKVLVELSKDLEQEKREREKLKSLQYQIEDNLALSREKFLLKLVMGGISSTEAVEASQQLALDIVARYYLVVIIHVELCESSPPLDYQEYQRVERIVSDVIGNQTDVLMTKKDLEEIVLINKGDNLDQLLQEGHFLAEQIKNEVEEQTTCSVSLAIGSYQERLSDIHHSFAQALVMSKFAGSRLQISRIQTERIELVNLEHAAIEDYMKFGSIDEYDDFFINTLLPSAEVAQQSYIMKHYLFVDIILTASQFISDLCGEAEKVASEVHEVEDMLSEITTLGQIKEELRSIFTTVLSYRNDRTKNTRNHALQQAKAYLDSHYTDPDLKMSSVAEMFNISPSHFSTTFHQEFGITFRDHLCQIRINHAKVLLRTSHLKCSEIAYQSGFNDSHYFSFVFKKKTGLSPRKFRSAVTE